MLRLIIWRRLSRWADTPLTKVWSRGSWQYWRSIFADKGTKSRSMGTHLTDDLHCRIRFVSWYIFDGEVAGLMYTTKSRLLCFRMHMQCFHLIYIRVSTNMLRLFSFTRSELISNKHSTWPTAPLIPVLANSWSNKAWYSQRWAVLSRMTIFKRISDA